jgi:lantibiotic biosynthesis protein
VERFYDAGTWPCGVPEGHEAPGLRVGLAGIGHFYLGLHDPAVPSALAR